VEQRQEKMIQETHDTVVRIDERLKAGDERFDRLEEDQEKHARVLFGSGKTPGLIDDVRGLTQWKKFWERVAWAAVGALAPVLAAASCAAAWWAVKHLP
jgi:hypothetical protein